MWHVLDKHGYIQVNRGGKRVGANLLIRDLSKKNWYLLNTYLLDKHGYIQVNRGCQIVGANFDWWIKQKRIDIFQMPLWHILDKHGYISKRRPEDLGKTILYLFNLPKKRRSFTRLYRTYQSWQKFMNSQCCNNRRKKEAILKLCIARVL